MYVVRTPRYRKSDPAMRWALPDRVFFACGACHILAHAFLERHESVRVRVVWIRPDTGFAGHHVFVDGGAWTFDYHGFVRPGALLIHHETRARQRCPGWDADLIEIPPAVLTSEAGSRAFDPALRLREPGQFLHDALPRARRFLDRFPAPPG
ncbi:hypothetical protein [Lichenibacterium dinghuense]|uniref:hypothetical protein n=1 Tax=Lichenibacterium dinghuense TaxID=2895977 RepID=UPI001F2BD7D7|nr:hypothetical protein [Lichenibacterium sp. 6Y81]